MNITVDILRTIWNGGIEISKLKGWNHTAELMAYAISGGGADVSYDSNSSFTQTILSSKIFKNHIEKIGKYLRNNQAIPEDYKTIEFTVDDIPDLYYGLQHVNIHATLLKDGRIKFTISDTYDFTELRAISKIFKDFIIVNTPLLNLGIPLDEISIGDLANDVGTLAQKCGVIKSFNIKISGYYGTASSKETSVIEKFVEIAESQIGYIEGNNNNTKYGTWYNLNFQPWCAMFVSWCAAQAGILNSIVPKYCYCPYGVNAYQLKGRYHTKNSGYIPKRGDIIFFQENGVASHTGIVTSVSGNIIHTVEGNKSDRVTKCSYNIHNNYILGYGINEGNSSTISGSSITLLKLGSTGEAVKQLQSLLISKGYSCGSAGVDGDFGQGTYNAVIAFQKDYGLDVDGIVGPLTWAALNNTINNFNNTSFLQIGSSGETVKQLQILLISKGYSCGSAGADGDFGQGTYNAVIAFQKDYRLEADGIVGPLTWAALNGTTTIPNQPLLQTGNVGESVKKLQEILISKGYSCGSTGADGDFGQGTYNAVIAFQKANGLSVDGIVGPATWNALNGNINCNELLQLNSKGEAVKRLQNTLISKGYNCGSTGADGDFGQGTYNAVIAFQKDYGLEADGIVGPATWNALSNITSTSRSLLKIGSLGSNVVLVQKLLISKGYSCGSAGADGDFGQSTYNAVIAFQKANGLSVDGIVGPATWRCLES